MFPCSFIWRKNLHKNLAKKNFSHKKLQYYLPENETNKMRWKFSCKFTSITFQMEKHTTKRTAILPYVRSENFYYKAAKSFLESKTKKEAHIRSFYIKYFPNDFWIIMQSLMQTIAKCYQNNDRRDDGDFDGFPFGRIWKFAEIPF